MKKLFQAILALLFTAQFVSAQIEVPDAPEPPAYLDSEGIFFGNQKVSPEEEKEFLEKLPANLRNQVESIKKIDEKKYNQLIRKYKMKSRYWSLAELEFGLQSKTRSKRKERDKKIYELDLRTEVLGVKYTNANSADKAKIKQELKTSLSELFELREQKRQEEVKSLESRLAELKQKLKIRKENKNEIIDRRIQELIGQNKYLEWD